MSHYDDQPMYRTFEEFEREELRRADSITSSVDELFDGLLTEELDFRPAGVRAPRRDAADDEE
jgi:hypothetical protein